MADNSISTKVGQPVVIPAVGDYLRGQNTVSTQGFGTVTLLIAIDYFRFGGVLKAIGRFRVGTPTAVEARINLPNSLITAATAGGISVICGKWWRTGTGATTNKQGAVIQQPGVNYVNFGIDAESGATVPNAIQLGSNLITGSEDFWFCFDVPIAGWESMMAYGAGQASSTRAGLVGGWNGATIPQYAIGEKVTFTDRTVAAASLGAWSSNTTALGTLTTGTWLLFGYFSFPAGSGANNKRAGFFTNSTADSSGIINIAADAMAANANSAADPALPLTTGYYSVPLATGTQNIFAKAFVEDSGANITLGGYAVRIA